MSSAPTSVIFIRRLIYALGLVNGVILPIIGTVIMLIVSGTFVPLLYFGGNVLMIPLMYLMAKLFADIAIKASNLPITDEKYIDLFKSRIVAMISVVFSTAFTLTEWGPYILGSISSRMWWIVSLCAIALMFIVSMGTVAFRLITTPLPNKNVLYLEAGLAVLLGGGLGYGAHRLIQWVTAQEPEVEKKGVKKKK